MFSVARRRCARSTRTLFWAFAYNVAAIPLAALGYLSPAIRRAAMALSSVSVVTNTLTLKRWRARGLRGGGGGVFLGGPWPGEKEEWHEYRQGGGAIRPAAKTIRYYEEIGLVVPHRLSNGYRDYDLGQVRRLQFVHRARGLGFTIEECRVLLSLYDDNPPVERGRFEGGGDGEDRRDRPPAGGAAVDAQDPRAPGGDLPRRRSAGLSDPGGPGGSGDGVADAAE